MPKLLTSVDSQAKVSRLYWALRLLVFLIAFICLRSTAPAQSITNRPPDQIGPNSRVWIGKTASPTTDEVSLDPLNFATAVANPNAVAVDQNASASDSPATSRVEEIATGMNYWDGEKWTPSQATFDVAADGFIATHLQYLVNINAQINTPNAINILTRDGIMIRSTPVALALYDRASGASVIIGAITNSTGLLVNSNKVVFESAFHGVAADLVYTIEKGSFEQDVVLRTKLDPAQYNFPRETTSIQVLTEVFEAPAPEKIRRPLYVEEREDVRNQMATPDLVDEVLGFGEFVLPTGRAFSSESEASATNVAASVSKEFKTIEGRRFLIESVEFTQVKEHLDALPAPEQREAALKKRLAPAKSRLGYAAIPSPAAKINKEAKLEKPKNSLPIKKTVFARRKGVTIDFIAVVGGTISTATTFAGDTTYYVSGAAIYTGPVTIEGGAVIKFKHQTTAPVGYASVKINNTLTLKTTSYRPAIFTAADDTSVGEQVSNNGIQSGGYANPALWVFNAGSQQLSNCRFSFCQEAIRLEGIVGSASIRHVQVVNCIRGVVITGCGCGAATAALINSLFAKVSSPATVSRSSTIVSLSNCTIDTPPNSTLANSTISASAYFYNCILANVYQLSSGPIALGGHHNGFFNIYANQQFGTVPTLVTTSPFQTQGAGNYYLTAGTACRNAGTFLNSTIASELAKCTVDPPTLLSGNFSDVHVFGPQVTLDTGTNPHLGVHYDPVDFLVSQLSLSGGGNAILTNAVTVAISGANGFSVGNQGAVISEGSPLALNRLIFYPSVQEQTNYITNPNLTTATSSLFAISCGTSTKPVISLRFTDLPGIGKRQNFFDPASFPLCLSSVSLKDCSLRGINFAVTPTTMSFPETGIPLVTFWNNLLERSAINCFHGWNGAAEAPLGLDLYNNLFWRSAITLTFNHFSTAWYVTTWHIQDNLFDNADCSLHGTGDYSIARVHPVYNAFIPTSSSTLGGDYNIFLTSLAYTTGPEGSPWYVGSSIPPLYQADTSRTAAAAGLYHYAFNTNQVKAASGNNSIGWHHIALGANNLPVDSDGDLKPDYAEDWTGDGLVQSGESSYINPAIVLGSSPVDYFRGHHPIVLDGTADFSTDTVDFNTGQLTISIVQGAGTGDQIDIKSDGTSPGQIATNRISGVNYVQYSGVNIGSYSGGIGNQSLVVQLSTCSTAAARALLRNITFANVANNLSLALRVVRFVITDGHGGTSAPSDKTVNVKCPDKIDLAIMIDGSGSMTLDDLDWERSAAMKLSPHLSLLPAAATPNDRVTISRFCYSVTTFLSLGSNKTDAEQAIPLVTRCEGSRFDYAIQAGQANLIGSGRSDAYKVIVLMTDGRLEAEGSLPAQQAARDARNAGIRIITVRFGTATGGQDAQDPLHNDPSREAFLLSLASTPANYYHTTTHVGHPEDLDDLMCQIAKSICRGAHLPTVAVTAPAPNSTFTLGNSITVSGNASDVCGQISKVEFFANNVKIGERVQTPYSITWTPPAVGTYLLRADATDNDANTAHSADVQITVQTHGNLDPTVLLPGPGLVYTPRTSAKIIDSTALVTDEDSPDFDAGALTVEINLNADSQDSLGIAHTGTGSSEVNLLDNIVFCGGLQIGQVTSGLHTPAMQIRFNANATPARAQALASAITYQSLSATPPIVARTVRMKVEDGDGGTSLWASKSISIQADNSAPRVVAGPNQSIIRPSTARLAGTVSDDGLPVGSTLTHQWSLVDGDSYAASLDDSSSLNPLVTFGSKWLFAPANIAEPAMLLDHLQDGWDDLSTFLWNEFDPASQQTLNTTADPAIRRQTFAHELNIWLLRSVSIYDYDPTLFSPFQLSQATWDLLNQSPVGEDLIRLNRMLLADVYTSEINSGVFNQEFAFRLTASDGQLQSSDEITIWLRPANTPPIVDAGPDQRTFVDPPTTIPWTAVQPIHPIAVDYDQTSKGLIVSCHYSEYPEGTDEFREDTLLKRINRDGVKSSFGDIPHTEGGYEFKIVTARDQGQAKNLGGFPAGDVFVGNLSGGIIRFNKDGYRYDENGIVRAGDTTVVWKTLPSVSGEIGALYFDQTGLFGGDLLVLPMEGQKLIRISFSGALTNIDIDPGGNMESLVVLPNLPERYGPLAGKAVIIEELSNGNALAVTPDGQASSFELGIHYTEDLHVIPSGESFYASAYSGAQVQAIPSSLFKGMEGDLLISTEDGDFWRVWWNGSAFERQLLFSMGGNFEHGAFCPSVIGAVDPGLFQLSGMVCDDLLPLGRKPAVKWTQIVGPATAAFEKGSHTDTPSCVTTQTTVHLPLPGRYIFRLTGDDGEFVASDDVEIEAKLRPTLVVTPPVIRPSPVGLPFVLTAKVLDAEDQPMADQQVQWASGADGANPFQTGTAVTDSQGIAHLSIIGATAGQDLISISAAAPGTRSVDVSATWAVQMPCGQTKNGAFANTDARSILPGNSFPPVWRTSGFLADYYFFDGTADSTVTATVTPSDHSCKLRIWDPVGASVASASASVSAVLPRTGRYTIEVWSEDNASAYSLHLTCNPFQGAHMLVSANGAYLMNGDQVSFTDIGSKQFEIVNTGPLSSTLYIDAIRIQGTSPLDFSRSAISFPQQIHGDSYLGFPVSFTPVPGGSRQAGLEIAYRYEDSSPVTFTVALKSIAQPTMTVRYGHHFLTNQQTISWAALSSVTADLVLSNLPTASANLLINTPTLSGTDLSHFTSSSPNLPATLPPGNSTLFSIGFNPQWGQDNNNERTATLSIPSSDPTNSPFVLYFVGRPSADTSLASSPSITLSPVQTGNVFPAGADLDFNIDARASTTNVLTDVRLFAEGNYGITEIFRSVPGTGQLTQSARWSKLPPGEYYLRAIASDSSGKNFTSQPIHLVINRPDVPNKAPIAFADEFFVSGSTTDIALDVRANDYDPDGDALGVTAASTPAHGSIRIAGNGEILAYTPVDDFIGSDSFTYTVTDTQGSSSTATVTIRVFDSHAPNGQSLATAEIKVPADGVEITAPTNIIGTASLLDGNNNDLLLYYTLEYRIKGDETAPWVRLSSGDHSVTAALLGTFDPTLLVNGVYDIRLTAVDRWGQGTQAQIGVVVRGGMKIGQFTLAYTDLNIPVNGLPITVNRTYNSGDSRFGDFGAGWQLDINSVRLTQNMPLGANWYGSPTGTFQYILSDFGPHIITVTFPDGTVYRFSPTIHFGTATGLPYHNYPNPSGTLVFLEFLPLPGTSGKLRLANSLGLSVAPFGEDPDSNSSADYDGWVTLTDDLDDFVAFFTSEYVFTTLDGREFTFDESGKVKIVKDRAQNMLTITANGIVSSRGKSVKFLRDGVAGLFAAGSGPITRIFDPEGLNSNGEPTGPPVLKYDYDRLGNLLFVHRLTSRTANNGAGAYATSTYHYEIAAHPHYITSLDDARGINVARSFYDDKGRLDHIDDARGLSTKFYHDDTPSSGASGRERTVITKNGAIVSATINDYDHRGNVNYSVVASGQQTWRTYDRDTDVMTSETRESQDAGGAIVPLTRTFDYTGSPAPTIPTRITAFYPVGGDANSARTTIMAYNDFGLPTRTTSPRFSGNSTGFQPHIENAYDSVTGFPTHNDIYFRDDTGAERSIQTVLNAYYNGSTPLKKDLLQSSTDAVGTVTIYDYYTGEAGGAPGELKTVTVPSSDPAHPLRQTVYTHDLNGNVLTETEQRSDADGNSTSEVTENQYDAQGRLIKTYDRRPDGSARGLFTERSYDIAGRLASTTDRYRKTTYYYYNGAGELTKTVYPDGSLARNATAYFAIGVNGAQRQTISEQRHFADEGVYGTRTVYDSSDRVISTGRLRTLQINETQNGDLIETEFLSGSNTPDTTTTAEYTIDGRVWRTVDGNGVETVHEYDSYGLWKKTYVDEGRFVTIRTFDLNGNELTSQFIADGVAGPVTTSVYDDQDRLRSTQVANLRARTKTYDDAGRVVLETDEDLHQTGFGYDKLGRLTYVTNAYDVLADRTITQYKYDEAGNLLTSTDANLNTTRFSYDPLGRRISRRLPGTQSESWLYDSISDPQSGQVLNQQFHTDFNSFVTRFEYDSMGRIVAKVPVGVVNQTQIQFTYTSSGQRKTMTDTSGLTRYVYDEADRLQVKASPQGHLTYEYDGNGNVTRIHSQSSYQFDGAGQITSTMPRPNGVDVHYRWDSLNRLWKVNPDGADETAYTYEARYLKEFTYPNGLRTSFGYNTAEQLTSVAIAKAGQTPTTFFYDADDLPQYRLSPSGRRNALHESLASQSRVLHYHYDSHNRLLQEEWVAPSGSISYGAQNGQEAITGYDAVGNRRSRDVTSIANVSIVQDQRYDADDRLTQVGATPRFQYDNNGNTTVDTKGTAGPGDDQSFQYDFENHLVGRTGAGTAITIVYDGDGNRVKKTVGTAMTYYLVDDRNPTGYAQVLEEQSVATGTPTTRYVYGLRLIRQERPTTDWAHASRDYYGHDSHGSVRLMTDKDGLVTDTYTYDAFGILLSETHPVAGATVNTYLYAGEQFDADLSLYYLRARYYDPQGGRFWTMDSFEGIEEDPLSLHKYGYARGNPINRRDSTGHEDFTISSVLTAAGIDTAIRTVYLSYVAAGTAKAAYDLHKLKTTVVLRNLQGEAYFGYTSSFDYKTTFFDAYPQIQRGTVWVHHAVPQKVLEFYRGLVTENEINSLENLRGISLELNNQMHLREIGNLWRNFYSEHPTTTREELLEYATEIDDRYGHLFKPAIR